MDLKNLHFPAENMRYLITKVPMKMPQQHSVIFLKTGFQNLDFCLTTGHILNFSETVTKMPIPIQKKKSGFL